VPIKHPCPEFLVGIVKPEVYARWLSRKAAAHARRDQRRFGEWTSGANYRELIHAAVVASGGRDAYTGEYLNWSLLSKYNNEASQKGKHAYKAEFALLPTIDHIEADSSEAQFCVCAWRTNDAKHDLTKESFVELCLKVLRYHGYKVDRAN
jgi:hypothetical protein